MLDGLALTVLNGGVTGQRTSWGAGRGGKVLQSLSYGYDPRSRLAGITSGDNSFAYTYAANSDLVEGVTSSYRGNQVLGGSRVYDNNNRLDSLSYSVGANVVSLHDYQYDLLHRRTRANRGDAHYWTYGYNDRSEVISARKFAPDNSGLAGWGSGFAFDATGNRQWADRGGDGTGAGMRRTSYTPNSLNQYTSVANPGGFDVLGEAVAAAAVTVNGAATERKGGLFRKEISVDNSAGAVREPVGITATLAGAGLNGTDVVTQRNGHKVVRSANEPLTHDLDGNLLGDDRWSYTWNGENRLAAVETSAAAVTAGVAKRKWAFDYDAQGRRIRKSAYSWDGTAWGLDQERLCVYDGWNLVAELDGASGDLVQRHTWGLDVSGSAGAGQGATTGSPANAGGVGGLLSLEDFTGLPIPLYYTYDGNGNVMALVRATDGEVVAGYEYSAFGELLRAEGAASDINPWRHATKYQDESGLLYYGFRYYSPETGRWLSRDPIGEEGGVNLYGFVGNDGVNGIDRLGETIVPSYPIYGPPPVLTEEQARLLVGHEIGRWQGSGYYFAADLFTHFLNQRGPVYKPSNFNISEVKVHGKKKICRLIKKEVEKNPALAPLNVSIKPKNPNDSNIRWVTGNNNMAFAYGGARLFASGCADSNGKGIFKIKLQDLYEFDKADDGIIDLFKQKVSQLLSSPYDAAVTLERVYGYQTFSHSMEFELKCSGKE